MRLLITGATGYVGSLLLDRLAEEATEEPSQRYALRALAREPARIRDRPGLELIEGDILSGAGLARALDGVDAAFYLIHSMETSREPLDRFPERERLAAENFASHAQSAGLARVVYLGGPLPHSNGSSRHLYSRAEVEKILMNAVPDSVTLRASIVLGARSRSFRLLVRLVERLPLITLPPWSGASTQPIDERDLLAMLLTCASSAAAGGRALDIGGPRPLTYGEMIERIAESMLLRRPRLAVSAAPVEVLARLAAAVSGEDPALAIALMETLEHGDLLPGTPEGPHEAAALLGVTLHSFESSLEYALREWELTEPLRAR